MGTRPTKDEVDAVKAECLKKGYDEIFEIATGPNPDDYAVLYRPMTEDQVDRLNAATSDSARSAMAKNILFDCIVWPPEDEVRKVFKRRAMFPAKVEKALARSSGFDGDTLGKKL